ncbi:Oidioi.mRNA.OKI2018_I69.XSR.g15415.t1.cds [Oikopleura dioica]|uniref:Oidioi.mRNA.OKI2018_I69.XSR.g15415.t1.cds n=1 Tax=Oikopleura dioica TaxID=34765 RepID=A0ABN7SHW8_OIKDI|nr:Oidioi.mRNA.OKI2018_I69.XSR.g15415.t1.cds [Oikopleura dioica]
MKLSAILSCVAAQFNPMPVAPQAPAAGGLLGGAAGGMQGILPLLLLGDGLDGSDDLLPLLLLGGGLGGAGGAAGDMSSILPLLLLGDDEITSAKMDEICTNAETTKKQTDCAAAKTAADNAYTTCAGATGATADDIKACEKTRQTAYKAAKSDFGKKNKLTDLLLLTSLAGPGGMGAGGMNSLLPLLLLGDGLGSSSSSSDDLLPLLLLSGGLGGGAVDPITGQQAGGLDPLMMMLLLD